MAQMGVAIVAVYFGAFHEKAAIRARADGRVVDIAPKAGPTGAAFVFVGLIKQGGVAAQAMKHAGRLGKAVMTMRTFGAMATGDLIGQRRQLCAPFLCGFVNFSHGPSRFCHV